MSANRYAVKHAAEDLFHTPLDQPEIDFDNEGGETFICGNPPFKGNADQNKQQKEDIKACLSNTFKNWKSLDYVCGWFYLAQQYQLANAAEYAFVSTNSICQGQNIPNFWRQMVEIGTVLKFAVLSFKWNNLAKSNAGVTVVIIGAGQSYASKPIIYNGDEKKVVKQINPYLVEGDTIWIEKGTEPISKLSLMTKGNYYGLSEGLIANKEEIEVLKQGGLDESNIKYFKGSDEIIKGKTRYCIWLPDSTSLDKYKENKMITKRIESVKMKRLASPDPMAVKMASKPHQFREMQCANKYSFAVPVVSSEKRAYLPISLERDNVVFSNANFALYDCPFWNMALIASRVHFIWITSICGKLETRIRYSNTLGWNTFPVPKLTEKNKEDLTRCAEDILAGT